MNEEKQPLIDWTRVAAELQAYREFQRETWGSVGDMTIAKFISGTSTPQEDQQVRQAAQRYEAVRQLIEVVGGAEALNRAGSATARSAEPAACWRPGGLVKELSEALRGWVEAAGLAAAGMTDWLMGEEQKLNVGMLLGDTKVPAAARSIVWNFPLPDRPGANIRVELMTDEDNQFRLAANIVVNGEPYTGADARLDVHDADGGLEHSSSLAEVAEDPIYLDPGEYRLTFSWGAAAWRISLQIG